MSVKKITFKVSRASTYFTLGAVRFYDEKGNVYPVKFHAKDQLLENTFFIQGTKITGKVNTTNSYSTYYFVDSPFDTDKPTVTTYSHRNYWLSSIADTISVSFDIPIKISKIDFVPYCGDDANRKQNAVEITAINHNGQIAISKIYNTTSYLINQIYTAQTDELSFYDCQFFKVNNRLYTTVPLNINYETKMTSNTSPSPFVASSSSIYSTTYDAWKAFDGKNTSSDCWITLTNTTTGWIQLDFGTPKRLNTLTLTSRYESSAPTVSPKDFNILGSVDGSRFDKIKEIRNQTGWGVGEQREFAFENAKDYRYYRLEILANGGSSSYTAIGEIAFGYKGFALVTIGKQSKENIFNYGANSLEILNMPIFQKNYVLQKGVLDSSNGLLTKKLERKPRSIKI